MSIESNKKLVRSFYEAIEQTKYDVAENLCHKEFVYYPQVNNPLLGAKGFVDIERKNMDPFEGFKMTIEAMVAEEDKVAVYLVFEGPQTGEFIGVPPTGKTVKFSFMTLLRIADGKIIEKRATYDRYDILQQLGVNL